MFLGSIRYRALPDHMGSNLTAWARYVQPFSKDADDSNGVGMPQGW